jgi:kinetochore protein NDC80
MLPTAGGEKPAMGMGGLQQGNNSLGGIDTRRSSAYNNGGKANGPKNDPRPITDKAFVNNCIRTVITYLSTHGYPAAVAPKTLASPTAKDFTMVVQFLFQKFDPRSVDSVRKG